jgi:integrase
MSRHPNLRRRGTSGTYYARIFVPLDLQPVVGKSEISVSLRTKDYTEAKRRLAPVLDQWGATFEDLRRRQTLTTDDVQTAVWDHYNEALTADDVRRAALPTPAEIEAALDAATIGRQTHPAGPSVFDAINSMTEVEILIGRATWDARRKAARLVRLRSDLTTGDTRLIEPDADAFLRKHSFKIEKGSPGYRDLCLKLMRAEIDFLKRYAEREDGDFTGKPTDPIIAEPIVRTDVATSTRPTETIMGLFGKYERENPNDIRLESLKQARRDVQNFADFVGPHTRPSRITKAQVREWKDLLAGYPVRATDTNIFKGMSPGEIVAANKALDTPKPTLTRQTLRRYLGSLSGFCRWLVKNDYLQANPVAEMMPKKTGPSIKRSTFRDDALNTLFGSPLFKAAKSDQWRDLDKPGNFAVRDHRFWIPWLMLYSGARPAEVAQLHVEDVRQEHGVWIMDINDYGESEKRTKTAGSRRVVPIHSALIALGFLKHIERQRAVGEVQVFPEIEIPEEGQIAAQFSREFNRYLAKIGVKKGKDIVTYSLRHTFIDRARAAGFLDDVIAIVVGHETGKSKKTMTSGYGNEQQGIIELRQKIVEAVMYSGLPIERPSDTPAAAF